MVAIKQNCLASLGSQNPGRSAFRFIRRILEGEFASGVPMRRSRLKLNQSSLLMRVISLG